MQPLGRLLSDDCIGIHAGPSIKRVKTSREGNRFILISILDRKHNPAYE